MTAGLGDDLVVGGLGRDIMAGQAGVDAFRFRSAAEAGIGGARDVIQDFQSGGERIDLRAIDANLLLAGNDIFEFIGAQAFSGGAGELRYDGGIISGNIDGDLAAEFEISLANAAALEQADFLL
jgi:Ca2+-binding RTX toxin-like protein